MSYNLNDRKQMLFLCVQLEKMQKQIQQIVTAAGGIIAKCDYSGEYFNIDDAFRFNFGGVERCVSIAQIENVYWDEDWADRKSASDDELLGIQKLIAQYFIRRYDGVGQKRLSMVEMRKMPLGRVVLELGYKPGQPFTEMESFFPLVRSMPRFRRT
jgi:hypothetical protein